MHRSLGAMWQYEIRVEGELNPEWSMWFEPLRLAASPPGETVLTGPITDQAALFGLLTRVRDLGLPLVSVTRLPAVERPDR